MHLTVRTQSTLFIMAALFLSACGIGRSAEPEQKPVCVTRSIDANVNGKLCEIGQQVVFMPDQDGNGDIAFVFVAANCDATETFNFTNGGAICVFNPTRPMNKPTDKPQLKKDRE